MSFADAAARFEKTQAPEQSDEWLSPYRLLWGAAYALGTAESSIMGGGLGDIPLDLSPYLKATVHQDDKLPWFHKWEASFMLTNAIFRVAAAAEKICYLADPALEEDRGKLWPAAAAEHSPLSKNAPEGSRTVGEDAKAKRSGRLPPSTARRVSCLAGGGHATHVRLHADRPR